MASFFTRFIFYTHFYLFIIIRYSGAGVSCRSKCLNKFNWESRIFPIDSSLMLIIQSTVLLSPTKYNVWKTLPGKWCPLEVNHFPAVPWLCCCIPSSSRRGICCPAAVTRCRVVAQRNSNLVWGDGSKQGFISVHLVSNRNIYIYILQNLLVHQPSSKIFNSCNKGGETLSHLILYASLQCPRSISGEVSHPAQLSPTIAILSVRRIELPVDGTQTGLSSPLISITMFSRREQEKNLEVAGFLPEPHHYELFRCFRGRLDEIAAAKRPWGKIFLTWRNLFCRGVVDSAAFRRHLERCRELQGYHCVLFGTRGLRRRQSSSWFTFESAELINSPLSTPVPHLQWWVLMPSTIPEILRDLVCVLSPKRAASLGLQPSPLPPNFFLNNEEAFSSEIWDSECCALSR